MNTSWRDSVLENNKLAISYFKFYFIQGQVSERIALLISPLLGLLVNFVAWYVVGTSRYLTISYDILSGSLSTMLIISISLMGLFLAAFAILMSTLESNLIERLARLRINEMSLTRINKILFTYFFIFFEFVLAIMFLMIASTISFVTSNIDFPMIDDLVYVVANLVGISLLISIAVSVLLNLRIFLWNFFQHVLLFVVTRNLDEQRTGE
ncbi:MULTISPECIES: hypothetical protein [Hyphobacterium]|uniref:Glycerophosphoryl diester phosphodiesterase membrane domain-containing protein n=1 Tax=Hyphobacterium vulgare TaxID=1736751 RepID=A0ABV6ZZK2_9PROT